MQEKSFNFRESYGVAISAMDDRTAGKFIKNICKYVFDNKVPESNESTLKSSFTLIKNTLDEERETKRKAKMSEEKSSEIQSREKSVIGFCSGEIHDENMDEVIKAVMENVAKKQKK